MIDLGLTTGIKELWQENLLRDYTLIVEGREFQVHKVVLAAVSKYFKAMLGEPFRESKMDRVEVKGFSADIVSTLLDFIYTGEEVVFGDDTLEVLQCAIYLQMPRIAEFCVKNLMENVNIQNWPEILSSMIEYSFHQEVLKVRTFVQTNWVKVVDNFNPEVTSYEAFQVLIEFWERSEWEKFLCIKNWISVNYEDNRAYVNNLMSQVRFCLVGAEELQTITQMDLFSNTEDSYQDLVDNALRYHQLRINLKVLDKSEQSRVTTEPVPSFFTPTTSEPPEKETDFYALDKENKWRKHEQNMVKSSILAEPIQAICIEVNNFLVVCATADGEQEWWIFDPRTLTWSRMTGMKMPKVDFVMVHHNDNLYIVGGQYLPEVPTCEMEQYSFHADKWTSFNELPTSLLLPSACVAGDTVYVSGGSTHEQGATSRQDSRGFLSLDLSSHSTEWEMKAPCLFKCSNHDMFVVRRNEDALLIIDRDLQMQSYSPSRDQWTRLVNNQISDIYESFWLDNGIMLAKGNTLSLLNVNIPVFEDDDEEFGECIDRDYVAWSWEIPEKGRKITELNSQEIPPLENLTSSSIFGAMLAIPPQHSGKEIAVIEV